MSETPFTSFPIVSPKTRRDLQRLAGMNHAVAALAQHSATPLGALAGFQLAQTIAQAELAKLTTHVTSLAVYDLAMQGADMTKLGMLRFDFDKEEIVCNMLEEVSP